MTEPTLAEQLKEAEAAIAQAERQYGREHPEVADKLQRYAALLRQTEKRTLDAVNIEARAKAIRAKMYADEERQHAATPAITVVKPPERPSNVGMYLGITGVFLALTALFVSQALLKLLVPAALILAAADVVISRSGLWRIAMVLVFGLSAWCANQSMPENMMVDATPIERFNYASDNPEIVSFAHKLSKPVSVLDYSICLPEGYSKQDSDLAGDWGKAVIFQGPAHPDTNSPRLAVIKMKLPENLAKRAGHFSVLKVAKEQAMARVADLFNLPADAVIETPQMDEVNGFQFAHLSFRTRTDVPTSGFLYAAAEGRNMIILAAKDETSYSEESLRPLEASIYTFSQQWR